jgi:glyoxylase-like metal-dependent hydrolase (beta-lactamase superfamily II)
MRLALILLSLIWSTASTAAALELKPVQVSGTVYAVIGDLGAQTYENDGLNANLGFVVGSDAVLVVNTGPSRRVAEALHAAIRRVTDKPVKWAVNVNSQNHYWHGNDYFRSQGARILAQREAGRLMCELGPGQLAANTDRLKEKAAGTRLAYPDELVDARGELRLGSVEVQVLHFGAAHTVGDLTVWLPNSGVLFAGDIVYTERMLAVIPVGNTGNWLKAFDQLAALSPKQLVPGHGNPADIGRARRDTRDYLAYLREQAKVAFDRGENPDDFAKKLDQSRFRYLANFGELAGRNANTVFLEIEKESF